MFVRVLGPVAVGLDDSDTAEPSGVVTAAVVGQLALARGRTVDVDDLVDRIWDVPPDNPRNALQAAVSRVRRAFGPDLVRSSRTGYRIDADVVVDVALVEADLREARRSLGRDEAAAAAGRAAAALARFVGEPLAGLESLAAQSARAAIDELRLAVVLVLSDALVLDDRADAAVPLLREEVARRPLVEPLHASLLRALAASGRSSEAVEAYDAIRRRVADELGTDPSPELTATFHDVLAGRDVRARLRGETGGQARARVVLPARRQVAVGRERDVEHVETLLDMERVVTLVGLGGVGKTTLALAVARVRAGRGSSDVVFVSAEVAGDADRVLRDVSRAWGGDGDPALAHVAVRAALGGRDGLLVLDNCEDVDVATEVGTLLDEVAGLSILATSRRPLGLVGEAVHRVHGLDPGAARRLLEARARQLSAVDVDAATSGRLVAAVDCSPLGVEILAGRLADTSPSALLADVETTQGPRPLDDMVAWSRERLSPPAAALLVHLGDLPDGIGSALARHLVGDAAPAAMLELVRSGLAHRTDRGGPVWSSPEMVRGHVRGTDTADGAGRWLPVLEHYDAVHARCFHGFLPQRGERLDMVEGRANLVAVLACADGTATSDQKARLLMLLMAFDYELGISDPDVADQATRLTDAASVDLRGWLLAVRGRQLHRQNRPAPALAACDLAGALADHQRDHALAAVAHEAATHALLALGRNDEALARIEKAVASAELACAPGEAGVDAARLAVGTRRLYAGCLDVTGSDPDLVARAYDDALRRARDLGRPGLVLTDLCTWAASVGMDALATTTAAELREVTPAFELYTLAHADVADATRAWRRGDPDGLVVHAVAALEKFTGSGDVRWMGLCLWLVAEAAALRGDDAAAARVLGARAALQGDLDVEPEAAALIARVRASLGDRWGLLEREGRLLSPRDACALVPPA